MKKALQLLALSAFLLVPSFAYSQTEQIPSWVKATFELYAQDEISKSEMLVAMEYLIQIGLIAVSAPIVPNAAYGEKIPDDGNFYILYGPNLNSLHDADSKAEMEEDEWKFYMKRDNVYLASATIIAFAVFGSAMTVNIFRKPKPNIYEKIGGMLMSGAVTAVILFNAFLMYLACCNNTLIEMFVPVFWISIAALIFTTAGFALILDSRLKDKMDSSSTQK